MPADFLNYLRIREWQDLDAQLRQVRQDSSARAQQGARAGRGDPSPLLAGLLSHIGMRDRERRDYLGARGTRFAIFPGSALAKKPPEFVMAAELVETSRLWARMNAAHRAGVGGDDRRPPGQATVQRAALVEASGAP